LSITPSSHITYTTFSEQIASFLATAIGNEKAVAIWRLPEEQQISGCIGHILPNYSSPVLSKHGIQGFAFHPFDDSIEAFPPIFIQNEISFESFKESFEMSELPLSFLQAGIHSIHNCSNLNIEELPSSYLSPEISKIVHHPYIEKVKQAVAEIENGGFLKVVLSDSKSVQAENLDIMELFIRACKTYHDAFVSIVAIPKVGIWVGATPELLVSFSNDQIFKTNALAGTKSTMDGIELKNIPWTHKEIEEQAFVSRYIVNCFKKIRVREYEESGPKTVQAGPLVHLRTDFIIDNKLVNYPDLPEVLLHLLHPTSAVCGMPKEPSLDFILNNERSSRKYYTGFLGPIDPDNGSSLYVNIRCLEITSKGANLYAGAGITATSNPENEAKEIDLKMQVMGKLLHQNS
jgi:isochorismate synthase